jgi:hypothetical protein
MNSQLGTFERLLANIAAGVRPTLNILPAEMRGPMMVTDDGVTSYGSGISPLTSSLPPPVNKRQKLGELARSTKQ